MNQPFSKDQQIIHLETNTTYVVFTSLIDETHGHLIGYINPVNNEAYFRKADHFFGFDLKHHTNPFGKMPVDNAKVKINGVWLPCLWSEKYNTISIITNP